MQYSDRAMSQLAFDHLLNLSLSFHIQRKTGEVLRILDRGAAINHIFELILFNIIPAFVDVLVALVLFAVFFDWTLTVVIFFVMFAYGTQLDTPTFHYANIYNSLRDYRTHPMAHKDPSGDERA